MYTTLRGVPAEAVDAEQEAGRPAARSGPRTRLARVSVIVLLLGVVSLITDLSSEMVVAVLPVYLTVALGLSPVQYGVVDGLYQGVSAAVRIIGGITADLTRRPKWVAVIGYGLSAVCKLFLLPASTFAAISAVISVDRTGKGLRTAPRDAIIAGSSDPRALGYSFGVHRALDTIGAFGGPLVAFGLLAALPSGYDAIFVLSFCLATVGVVALILFVPDVRTDQPASTGAQQPAPEPAQEPAPEPAREPAKPVGPTSVREALRDLGRLASGSAYRRTLAVAALVSLLTVSDGFVYLVMRDRAHVSATLFPLLYVGTSGIYMLLAVPVGRLADRIGRGRVFLSGYAIAVLAYLGLWGIPAGPVMVPAVLGLLGTYYACTDGVLSALTVPLLPAGARTTGLAGVQTVLALGNLVSAIGFGVLWATLGPATAVITFAAGLSLAVAVSSLLLRGVRAAEGVGEPA